MTSLSPASTVVETFDDHTSPAEGTCINQAQATMVLLDTNNLCNKPTAEEDHAQTAEAVEVVISNYKNRLGKIMEKIGTYITFADAANKAAAATQHMSDATSASSGQTTMMLSKYNSDAMTAKRVATLSQQDLLRTNVGIDYMQICCITFAVGILVMSPFALPVVRVFFKHPNAFMQALLVIVVVAAMVAIILRLWANRNHYHMLYQERVFRYRSDLDRSDSNCDCTPTASAPTEPIPIAVASDQPVCNAEE